MKGLIGTTTRDLIDTTTRDLIGTTTRDLIGTTMMGLIGTTRRGLIGTTMKGLIGTTMRGPISTNIYSLILPGLTLRTDIARRGNLLPAGVHVTQTHAQAGLPLPSAGVAGEPHPDEAGLLLGQAGGWVEVLRKQVPEVNNS